MSKERPVVRVPEGWTYDETSKFDFGRWITTYEIKHDACGEVKSETARPVGDGDDVRWYHQMCAEGLAFFIGNHPQNCPVNIG